MNARLLTVAETAAFLRVDQDDVRELLASRELNALVAVGRDALIAQPALREFIAASWVGRPYVWGGGSA